MYKESGLTSGADTHGNSPSRRLSLQNNDEKWIKQKSVSTPTDAEADMLMKACGRNRLFALISENERRDMLNTFTALEVETGQTLCTQGNDGCTFFIVESGHLSIAIDGMPTDPSSSSSLPCHPAYDSLV